MELKLTPVALKERTEEVMCDLSRTRDRRFAIVLDLYGRLSSDVFAIGDLYYRAIKESAQALKELADGLLPTDLHALTHLALEITRARERVEAYRHAIGLMEAELDAPRDGAVKK